MAYRYVFELLIAFVSVDSETALATRLADISAVLSQPAAPSPIRQRAEILRDKWVPLLSTEQVTNAQAEAGSKSLEAWLQELLGIEERNPAN